VPLRLHFLHFSSEIARLNPSIYEEHHLVMLILHLADLAQMATIGISLVGYLPQLTLILRRHDTRNVSLATWVMWTVSAALAFFYGIVHYLIDNCCLALTLTSSINLILCLTTSVAILIKRRQMADPKTDAFSLSGSDF